MADNSVSCEVDGLDELQRELELKPRKDGARVLRKAINAGADVVLKEIQANAPVETGFLEEHFGKRTRVYANDLEAAAFVGPQGKIDYPDTDGSYRQKTMKNGQKREVGRISVASVARYHEFGTSKMAANPFMTVGFESSKTSAAEKIIAVLKELLGL